MGRREILHILVSYLIVFLPFWGDSPRGLQMRGQVVPYTLIQTCGARVCILLTHLFICLF